MLWFCPRLKLVLPKEGIIRTRFAQFGAVCLLLLAGGAGAAGFGEIILHSRIGEPLKAEIPILSSPDEPISTACFSLAPVQISDVPVISHARTRLTGSGENLRVLVTGNQAINEPIFMISLRAGCGISLQRDFILMPHAPDHRTQPPSMPTSGATPVNRTSRYREIAARQGETLEDIAAANAPDDLVEQRRLLAALRRANPEYHPEQMLDEGVPVKLPNRPRRVAAQDQAEIEAVAPAPPNPSHRREAKTPKRPPRNALAALNNGGRDRVAIGPDTDPLQDSALAIAQREELQGMEDRMLKLATALNTLNLQVDNLNSAIAVTEEANALRRKLEQAESAQGAVSARASPALPPTVVETDETSLTQWVELVFSALAGGGMVAGIAHYLSQRNQANIRRVPLVNRSSQLPKRRRPGNRNGKAGSAKQAA